MIMSVAFYYIDAAFYNHCEGCVVESFMQDRVSPVCVNGLEMMCNPDELIP